MMKWLRKTYFRVRYWRERRQLRKEIEEIVNSNVTKKAFKMWFGETNLRSPKRLKKSDESVVYFSSNGKTHEPPQRHQRDSHRSPDMWN